MTKRLFIHDMARPVCAGLRAAEDEPDPALQLPTLASCTDILWARHAFFLPHERLLKAREHALPFARVPITAADFEYREVQRTLA